jgi:hypothetical protein
LDLKLGMCCQITDYRLPVRRKLPIDHKLLEAALDASNFRTGRQTSDLHDVLA